jgi:hypothetical protein
MDWDPRWAQSFRAQGFNGFVPLGDAVASGLSLLDRSRAELSNPGVYGVFCPLDWVPRWLAEKPLPNVIRPWTASQLGGRWIRGVELTYIGCACRTVSSRSLWKRLGDLLKHGSGRITKSGPHKGGERIWQCAEWETFTLAWRATEPYPQPRNLEVAIGTRFIKLTGALPFANVRL